MTGVKCRTCLESISGTSIISVQANVTDEKNILQAIEEVTSLKGSIEDLFPQYVCKKCLKFLKSAITFRRLIISSYTEFKEKLTRNRPDLSTEVSNVNSSSVEFIILETQPEIRTELKIEKDSPIIKGKAELENNKNEELKTESEDDIFNFNDGMKLDQAEVPVIIEPTSGTPQIRVMQKRDVIVSKNKHKKCSVCGKVLKGKQKYNSHMKLHTNQIPPLVYVCPVCPKQFSQKRYLLVHRRSHTGEKPFHCDICDKNFSQFASFYVHKRRLHDKVVQGMCSYCGKKFVDKPELDVHVKMWHTGE